MVEEKHTLKVLMVSSITTVEYFFGILIPNLLVMTGIQLLLVPALELPIQGTGFLMYALISLVTLLISNITGMCFGLSLKD